MNNAYKYVGVPLKPNIAQELIIKHFSGQTVNRKEIVATVIKIHEEHGGLPSESQDVRLTVKKALQVLKKKGVAENPAQGYWRIGKRPNRPEKENTFWEKVRDANDGGLTKLWIVLSSTFCVIATVIAGMLEYDLWGAVFILSGPCTFFGLWALGKGAKWIAKEFTTNDRNDTNH